MRDQSKRYRVLSEEDYVVEERGYETPCWIWTHSTSGGYGKVTVRKRKTWAHRAMWIQAHGPVPDGLELDHLCRQPSCIRPDHMEAVTHRENLRRGEGTRVTPDMLDEIRRLREVGLTHEGIADRVGVSDTTIWCVLNGHRWAD